MYPVLKIMHILNFLDTFSVGVTIMFLPNNSNTSQSSDMDAQTNVFSKKWFVNSYWPQQPEQDNDPW